MCQASPGLAATACSPGLATPLPQVWWLPRSHLASPLPWPVFDPLCPVVRLGGTWLPLLPYPPSSSLSLGVLCPGENHSGWIFTSASSTKDYGEKCNVWTPQVAGR